MADNAPVMVWVTDADGTCVFLSKSWYEFTGQMPGEGMGTGWSRAVHPDDRDLALRAFLMATERRQRFFVEYRLMHRDGSIRWAIDTAIPHFDHAGNYLGHIGSVLDITDRKIAEEALKDADRRKDEFLATLAHELRNPLAPLRSGLELLRMIGSDDPGFEEIRSIMERQLGHMVRLIDDLLDVSRISRNRLELRPELTDLSIVLRSALETSRPLIESARHHLTIEIPPQPIPMFADVTRMAQVFANLLNNAAKYTEQGGEIRVRADLRGDHVVVSVADNGAGIPEEMLPRVFDMFTQVEGTIERAHGGLGIGLTIVERLVEMHGGTVTVTSGGLGRGSEFTVMLPLASSRPEHAAPVVEEMATGRATDGLRVLVVDDNRDAAHSLSMVLRRMGSEIRVEHDGPAALAAAEEFEPDVILLDIGMPQMSGYEVARRLRQYPWGRSVTIVALTGWGQEEDRNRSREAGFDHHLLKPVEPATLRRLLSEMG